MHAPYESVKVEWNSDKTGLYVSLPWVSLEIEVFVQDRQWVEEAITYLHKDWTNQSVQRFLNELSGCDIAYSSPRSIDDIGTGLTLSDEPNLLAEDALKTPLSFSKFICQNTEDITDVSLPQAWEWDLEKICRVSNIKGTDLYDPITIVSYLKGMLLASDAMTDSYRQELPVLLDQLRERSEPKFFTFMLMMLRQTHYITEKFQQYVPLVLNIFSEAATEIQQFIDEEKGHDKLMELSLSALGCENPDDIKVLKENILIMELLNFAVNSTPLAFTVLVGYFEGGHYGDADPLAEVLKKSSVPKSAFGYERHFEINRDGDHNEVLHSFANKLPAQDAQSVAIAARILELACYKGRSLDQDYVNRVQALLS